MLKLKLQYFGHLCKELIYLIRPWCWERLRAGGEGDNREWDGWMALPTQWIWVWTSSGSWWWTGKPGVLQSMGLQSQTWLWDWTTATEWFLKIILRPYLKSQPLDFSDGPEVKNLPFNAGIWRFNSIPGWGPKMPYAAEQLIPHAWTKQPACRTYWACKRQWRPNTAKKKKDEG